MKNSKSELPHKLKPGLPEMRCEPFLGGINSLPYPCHVCMVTSSTFLGRKVFLIQISCFLFVINFNLHGRKLYAAELLFMFL